MVIALLSPPLLRHAEFVIGRREQFIAAASWSDLASKLQVHPVNVALIDPSADGGNRAGDFERLVVAYPSLSFIAYVPLTPQAFRAVAHLSRLGLEHVMVYSHDDSPARMLAAIERVKSSPLTDRFLDRLQPWVKQLPLTVGEAIHEMFAEPHRYPSAQDIAVRANVSLVRLYRSFQNANLAPPKRMLVAARLLRAYINLSDPGQSVGGVSMKLAYSSPRIFAEHANEVLGLTPSRMRSFLSEDDIIDKLLRWTAP